MKTTLGGERLGSGNKMEVTGKNYSRSTHDLSYTWRSTMASGTLVPFMSQLALPGDTFDIDLSCDVKTLPTLGPLFGSYKVQLDVFECPIRLFQGKLHMNMINVGMDMSKIKLPQMRMLAKWNENDKSADAQVNPSSIYSYLGVHGLGRGQKDGSNIERLFNAVPLLSYWSIYKQYYANLQESVNGEAVGYVIHQSDWTNEFTVTGAQIGGVDITSPATVSFVNGGSNGVIYLEWQNNIPFQGTPDLDQIFIQFAGQTNPFQLTAVYNNVNFAVNGNPTAPGSLAVIFSGYNGPLTGNQTVDISQGIILNEIAGGDGLPQLERFPLKNIDLMRQKILEAVGNPNAFEVNADSVAPYGLGLDTVNGWSTDDYENAFSKSAQEGLGIKCYQSGLNNNWLDTDWITGDGGVADVSAVLISQNSQGDDVVKMDALNLSQKIYNMLNRIAVSGGTYDDWLDAVYTHERAKGCETPVYHGSLIKELAFQEVVSTTDTLNIENQVEQPLGTLAGRGKLTGKHKGGKIRIKTHEPSFVIGIASITPRLDFSQGNDFHMNHKTMNDFHKPELSQIAFEDKITDTLAWFDTEMAIPQGGDWTPKFASAGKQPAWINYMSNVNKCKGNFADENKEMFMTLNRRYEHDGANGIGDLSTYIDPSKYNNIFAQRTLDSMNFWCQIGVRNIARRKMSAKLIPNL